MKITTRHPKSRHGVPVIIGKTGRTMPYPEGIEAALRILRMSKQDAAKHAGIGRYTVYGYCKGRLPPSAAFLNVLRDLLEDVQAEAVNTPCDVPENAQ
jgi:hypothetical protein